jgi:hypothetical protein
MRSSPSPGGSRFHIPTPLASPPIHTYSCVQRRRHHRRLSVDDDMDPLPYGAALPLEERFWDDVFERAKRWGLYTYEQVRVGVWGVGE